MYPWCAVPLHHALRVPALLFGGGVHNCIEWLENRLEEVAEVFAVAIGGFS